MSLFRIDGQVTSIGQSVFNNDITIYAFIEITEASGRRVSIERVAVCNDVSSRLQSGMAGEFFVDRLFRFSKLRCQLWGVKADGVAVYDRKNLRVKVAVVQLIYGIMCLPVFGLGLLLIVPSLFRLLTAGSFDRRKMFYGGDPIEARRLENQQALRI